jgi:heme-degrading monooxygenase HmoA
MSTTISCVEVPAGLDVLVERQANLQVYRAIAPDARFRYLTVGDAPPALTSEGPGAPSLLTGRYEVIHTREDAAAAFDPGNRARPVTFINCMVVEPGREDEAFAVWREINAYMVTKRGYRWHRLHRRSEPTAPFGQINVARWESAEAWRAAHDAGFRALAARPNLPFQPVATLCELVDDPELAAAAGSARGRAQ